MASTVSLALDFSLGFLERMGAGPSIGVFKGDFLGGQKFTKRLKSGTSNGQIDLGYIRTQASIAASATANVDLAGSLTDRDGTTITFVEIVLIILLNFNTAGTASLVQSAANGLSTMFVGGATSGGIAGAALSAQDPGFTMMYHPAGAAVTAGTGDIVDIINNDGANAITPTLGVFGRSA